MQSDFQNVPNVVRMTSQKQAPGAFVKSKIATFERLKSLPASVSILDASGTIVAVNDTWKQFGQQNGLRIPNSGIGSNYLQHCPSDLPRSRRFLGELKALLAGQLDLLTYIYPCHSPTRARWFSLIGLPLSLNKPAGVALVHVNLTEMLPLPGGTRRAQAKEDRKGRIRPGANIDAIGGALERSVLETLSSQLNTMFVDDTASREKDAAQEKDDEMTLVRTRLSKRQMQVLRLLGEGKTNKEMAKALLLSPNTIKLHVSAILQALNLRSRTQAALLSSKLLQDPGTEIRARAVSGD
ncbi:response regulator transcription factor [Bradyrhizobium sediminis]|uniref:Response regulator transcription factor n=1 Tax=Bradyrhizobium sediminis TaxID=2840469 RepID=A0A975NBU3_9BRAD|nr:response regulator transcription factor [Bradyrhizobium sediminis]QWG12217.1 response regulator transcription factor [Bradyrhizobium sediminis]